jgi:hypothetical protein
MKRKERGLFENRKAGYGLRSTDNGGIALIGKPILVAETTIPAIERTTFGVGKTSFVSKRQKIAVDMMLLVVTMKLVVGVMKSDADVSMAFVLPEEGDVRMDPRTIGDVNASSEDDREALEGGE